MFTDYEYIELINRIKSVDEKMALTFLQVHVKNIHNSAVDDAAVRAAGRAVIEHCDGDVCRDIVNEILGLKIN